MHNGLDQCAEGHHESEDAEKLHHLEQSCESYDSESFNARDAADGAQARVLWQSSFQDVHKDFPQGGSHNYKVQQCPCPVFRDEIAASTHDNTSGQLNCKEDGEEVPFTSVVKECTYIGCIHSFTIG